MLYGTAWAAERDATVDNKAERRLLLRATPAAGSRRQRRRRRARSPAQPALTCGLGGPELRVGQLEQVRKGGAKVRACGVEGQTEGCMG